MRAKDLSAAVVFAGLYAAGVIALPGISFVIIQVRISDALLPMAMVFGLPAVFGITVGTFIANMFSPFGIVDLLGGTLTNLIATYLAWKMARNFAFTGTWFFAAFVQVLIITFIVGTYLYVLLPPEEMAAIAESFAVIGLRTHPVVYAWLGLFLGSVVAVLVIGYPLAKAVARYLRVESRYV
ncbi:MAG: QueT transporter family protein [Candidatus Caldarchaeum sp.]